MFSNAGSICFFIDIIVTIYFHMYLNGRPYIPPHCPVVREGAEVALASAEFSLHIYDTGLTTTGRPTNTEVFVSFQAGDEDQDLVQSEVLEVLFSSDVSTRAHKISGGRDGIFSEGPTIEAMQRIFCDRIINCHGVVNGKCWALGSRAVQEVIEG